MSHATGATIAPGAAVHRRQEIVAIYAAGIIQGIALVTFPAVSVVFTNANDYALSSQQYGAMFIPQALAAIVASLVGAGVTRRVGARCLFLVGLAANLLAMILLVISRFVMHEQGVAYALLVCATGCMGLGFGLTVPALNTFAAEFFPANVEKAVLAMNALLGLGTALAPVFVTVFTGAGIWWGMPILVATMVALLLFYSLQLALTQALAPADRTRRRHAILPARVWLFALFAVMYGICETMNGNWAALYMSTRLGAPPAVSALALTAFWACVTAGRLICAALDRWISARAVLCVLPTVVAGAFVATSLLPAQHSLLGLGAFAVAGLGCSALLPLLISFAQRELTAIAASAAAALIAFYQVGYGIAAFGVGPLQGSAGLTLTAIYRDSAAAAIVMTALAFAIVRPRPQSAGASVPRL